MMSSRIKGESLYKVIALELIQGQGGGFTVKHKTIKTQTAHWGHIHSPVWFNDVSLSALNEMKLRRRHVSDQNNETHTSFRFMLII